MEGYSVYIPMDRRLSLAKNKPIPDHVQGSALFADISGFTPLTEALARVFGPQRGAEELTRQLNKVFDALVNELHKYGGSVISFAGDAITCWFEGDNGRLATTCALAMQSLMKQFETITVPTGGRGSEPMQVSLAMKAATTTGTARRFIIGDPSITTIDVLAGVTLEHLSAAEHQANQGEVLTDKATAEALGDELHISEWREDHETGEKYGVATGLLNPAKPYPPSTIPAGIPLGDLAQSWLLPPIYQRLSSGQGDFLAELRPGLSMFLSFTGLDYDNDERAGEKLDSYIRWVQQVLAKYEVYILQLIVGDKGSYLNACFGAPIAHEDDAERAVAAALELQNCPPEVSTEIKDIKIGIAMGRLWSGAYGGIMRRTYGIMGDDVNLAARLMQAALPGQIFASPTVFQTIQGLFNWIVHEPIRLKGKSEPVPVYIPTGRVVKKSLGLAPPEYMLPMVGRHDEFQTSLEKINQALQGQGQILGITGEAGIGKSRLIGEFIETISEMHNISAVGGECESYGTETSYLVWQSVWRGLFNLDPSLPQEEQITILEDVLNQINPDLVPRMPLLGTVLNFNILDNDLTRSFDAQLRKTSLEALLVDCLRFYARQSQIFLVLEDCQWLDPLSHDLIEVIGRAIINLPVMIVLGFRPPEIQRVADPKVSRLPNYTEIQLGNFTKAEASQLILLKVGREFGEQKEIPVELIEQITTRTQGNPFYIEELLNYIQDQGINPFDPSALQTLDLPTSLHSLILSRIDQLTDHQQITLKVASIIGRIFRAALLWGMYPELGRPEEIKADLDALSQMQLTAPDPSEPELAYLFRQIVTHEVAYENLPYALRATLHDQLAKYIEKNYSNVLDQYVDLLAFHYDKGEDWEKALEFNLKAAQNAQREFANDTAIAACQRALNATSQIKTELDTNSQQLLAYEILGEVLTLVGKYDEALENYEAARELMQYLDTPDKLQRLADLCRKIAGVYEIRAEYETAFEWIQKGLIVLDEASPSIEAAKIYLLGAGIYFRQGNSDEAKSWYQRTLDTAIQIHNRTGQQTLAQTYYALGNVYSTLGDYPTAVDLCQQSLEIYEQIDDKAGQARAYLNIGSHYQNQSLWDKAAESYDKSLGINEQIGYIQGQGFNANNLGNIYLDRGDYRQAKNFFQKSNTIWKQTGAIGNDAVTLSNLAQAEIYQKNFEAARAALEQSAKIFSDIGHRGSYLAELERRWAEYYLMLKKPQDALEHITISAEISSNQGFRLELGKTKRIMGEIQMALKNPEAAEKQLEESLEILTELNSEFEAAKVILSLGELQIKHGTHKSYRESLSNTVNTFTKLGALLESRKARMLCEQLDKQESI